MHNQFDLLKTKRFLPFFCTQFLGAFNDNVFKQSLIILLAFNAASMTTLSPSILAYTHRFRGNIGGDRNIAFCAH